MARPSTIFNQQILDAARAEFLAHGFTKASTVDIARRAGVSEGSIFNRFSTTVAEAATFDAQTLEANLRDEVRAELGMEARPNVLAHRGTLPGF
jgi:AcrR family transcriptional regulator